MAVSLDGSALRGGAAPDAHGLRCADQLSVVGDHFPGTDAKCDGEMESVMGAEASGKVSRRHEIAPSQVDKRNGVEQGGHGSDVNLVRVTLRSAMQLGVKKS